MHREDHESNPPLRANSLHIGWGRTVLGRLAVVPLRMEPPDRNLPGSRAAASCVFLVRDRSGDRHNARLSQAAYEAALPMGACRRRTRRIGAVRHLVRVPRVGHSRPDSRTAHQRVPPCVHHHVLGTGFHFAEQARRRKSGCPQRADRPRSLLFRIALTDRAMGSARCGAAALRGHHPLLARYCPHSDA